MNPRPIPRPVANPPSIPRPMHVRSIAPPALPAVGEMIAGKYALVRVMGEGGMGVVYEATHVRLRQRLAIKVLLPAVATSAELTERFEREARAVAQLQGINVARMIDVDVLPNGLPYMVLEYLEGHDLDIELGKGEALPISVAVDYVVQAATAMIEAHELGIIHRDLKPANLFLVPLGFDARKLVKVLDFGISKVADERDAHLTEASAVLGTPHYMSPEQLRAAREVDARSDIWSLGVILFELLTGHPPFEGSATAIISAVAADPVPRPTARRPDCPPRLERVIMRMLEKDPTHRPRTMTEVVDLLAPFAPKESISSVIARAPRTSGRIGEILLRERLITQEDLDCALEIQQRTQRRLGRVLVELGKVSESDLNAAIAKQQSVGEATVPAAPLRRAPRTLFIAAVVAAVGAVGIAAAVAAALYG